MAFPSLWQLVDAVEETELVVGMNVVEQTAYFLEQLPIFLPHSVGRMNHHFLLIPEEVVQGVVLKVVGLGTEAVVLLTAEFHYVFHCLMNR
jgi:hypothetical protein